MACISETARNWRQRDKDTQSGGVGGQGPDTGRALRQRRLTFSQPDSGSLFTHCAALAQRARGPARTMGAFSSGRHQKREMKTATRWSGCQKKKKHKKRQMQ